MTEQPYPQRYYNPAASAPAPSSEAAETRRDVDAAMAARLELGPEYEEHIAAGLAERVEQLAAYRTAELRVQASMREKELDMERLGRGQRLALGIVSLGTGIPITAISGYFVHPSVVGVLVAWAGIVGVNVAVNLGFRKKP